jgi:hypothetical protein
LSPAVTTFAITQKEKLPEGDHIKLVGLGWNHCHQYMNSGMHLVKRVTNIAKIGVCCMAQIWLQNGMGIAGLKDLAHI